MAINYREEVDSGYDRKIIVEQAIMELLKQGVPTEVISENSNFNIRHREMLKNLTRGYEDKLEQLEKLNDTFYDVPSDGLSESYTEVVHHLRELYPMSPEEEKEKFTKRDQLVKLIEDAKNSELQKLIIERDKILEKINELKKQYPILESIIKIVEEMDLLIANQSLETETIDKLFQKYDLQKSELKLHNAIYKIYDNIKQDLFLLNQKIDTEEKKFLSNSQIERLEKEKAELEEEIIKRNIKLVNWFIRNQYKKLLVEQEELYDICLIGMVSAVRNFNVSMGYKFSTYAFKFMDIEVKKHFKELTGYKWDDYWRRNNIRNLLEAVSEVTKKQATINDLYELGLLDVSHKVAEGVHSLPSIILDSYINDNLDNSTSDDYEKIDSYEDERYGDVISYDGELLYTENAVEDEVFMKSANREITEVLDTLTELEKNVIELRFGLRDGYPMTLEEVGQLFGMTRERIRQIESKALAKLRHPSRSSHLVDYIR